MKKLLLIFCVLFTVHSNAAVLLVDNTADTDDLLPYIPLSGNNTLRKCLRIANTNAQSDTISFLVAGGSVFSPASPYQTISEDWLVLTGDQNFDGDPDIVIDGTSAGSSAGLSLNGDHIAIIGLNIRNFSGNGIQITSSDSVTISGCYIGTDLTGSTAAPNTSHGIYLSGASNIIIGTSLANNIISGNIGDGIEAVTTSNVAIVNNLIGVDATGNTSMGNGGNGIYFNNVTSGAIGNSTAGGRNIISGNNVCGLLMNGGFLNFVYGNYFGVAANGSTAIGNSIAGITVQGGAMDVQIGGLSGGQENVISGNTQYGIDLNADGIFVSGNWIGLDGSQNPGLDNGIHGIRIDSDNNNITQNTIVNGTGAGVYMTNSTSGNRLSQNSIYGHGPSEGITIQGAGNAGVVPPVITGLTPADSTLSGTAGPFSNVQIFADSADEGQLYIAAVTADGSGNWSYKLTSSNVSSINGAGLDSLTAIQDSMFQHSSEFSQPIEFDLTIITGLSLGSDDVSVSPNPATNFVVVNGEDYESASAVGVNGSVTALEVNDGTIDVRPLGSGVYVLLLDSGRSIKIVKE